MLRGDSGKQPDLRTTVCSSSSGGHSKTLEGSERGTSPRSSEERVHTGAHLPSRALRKQGGITPILQKEKLRPREGSDSAELPVSSEGEQHMAGSAGGCGPFLCVSGCRGHSHFGIFAPAARSARHTLQTFPRLAASRRETACHCPRGLL